MGKGGIKWTQKMIDDKIRAGTIVSYTVIARPNNKQYAAITGKGMKKTKRGPEDKKRNKYGAVRVFYDGFWFDSGKECTRYKTLLWRLKKGEIGQLRLQVPYELFVNGDLVSTYVADFVYIDAITGATIVEDVKSVATVGLSAFNKNKKLMKAIFNIDILIT